MWQFVFLLFFISFCIFAGIMLHDSRTLRSGASFLFMMMCLAVFLFFTLSEYAQCTYGAYRSQKRTLIPLNWKLQVIVSHHVGAGN